MENKSIKSCICLSFALALCGLAIVFGDVDSLTVGNVESKEDEEETVESSIAPGTDLSLSSEVSEDDSEEDMESEEENPEAPANLKGSNDTYLPLTALQMFGSWFHPSPPHHKHKHTNGSAKIQQMKNESFFNRLKKNKTGWKIYQERSRFRQEFLANQNNSSNASLLPGKKGESWSPFKPKLGPIKQEQEGLAMAANQEEESSKEAVEDNPDLLPGFGDDPTQKLSPAGDVIPDTGDPGDTEDDDDVIPAAKILAGENIFLETISKIDGGAAPQDKYGRGVAPERAMDDDFDATPFDQPAKHKAPAVHSEVALNPEVAIKPEPPTESQASIFGDGIYVKSAASTG